MLIKDRIFQNNWKSDEVLPYIRQQLAEIRSNASKIVNETLLNMHNSTNLDRKNVKKVDNIDQNADLSLKYKNVQLLNFLRSSNNKLSRYNADIENSNIISDYSYD